MPTLRFGRARSPVAGMVWIAESDAGVAAISREPAPDPMLAGIRRRFPDAELTLGEVDASVLDGSTAVSLDLRGLSPFDARVYRVVAGIPSGTTMTYGEVAAAAGSPGAARAVGGAMARCPLFPAVPCHRVVRAMDGWSGWGGDDRFKRRLLRAEARRPSARRGRATDRP